MIDGAKWPRDAHPGRPTLGIFVLVNLALLRIKARESTPPAGVIVLPTSVPVAGLFTSAALLLLDLFG